MLTKNNLVKELKKAVNPENILTDKEECYVYSKDAANFREAKGLPDAVVFVETAEQVQNILKTAKKYRIPVICRGAGTNVVGACTTEHGGIILNFSKMNKILEINKENMSARVQSGVIVGDLQKQAEKLGLFFPPDPSNLAVSTIGGCIAQNSAGAKCFKYGAAKDYVLALTVVTADGEILHTGSNTIKNSTGYNLSTLFTGSEGTLGIITEASLKLIPKPQVSKVIMAYFDSISDSVNAVNSVIEQQIFPATLDFMDKNALQTVEKFYPAGILCDKEAALIIEIDGFENSIDYQKNIIEKVLKSCNAAYVKVSETDEDYEKIWTARRCSMAACAKLKPNVVTDDVIVPRENLSKLVSGIKAICEKHNLIVCAVGHVGDGSVHPQIPLDLNNDKEYTNYKSAISEIYDLTAKLGGILSGEHGIGTAKRNEIHKVVDSNALAYMREIKKVFDPDNILNPYKIF